MRNVVAMGKAGTQEGVAISELNMTDLTYIAKRIMEVFGYFRITQGDAMTLKVFLSRKHLWKDYEEEQVQDALNELIQRGFIVGMEEPAGWILLLVVVPGAQYIGSLKR